MKKFSKKEWESLCDKCGLCCLCKIEYENSPAICYTNVCCAVFDMKKFNCTNYSKRGRINQKCAILTAENIHDHLWLPDSCAYKLIYLSKDLPFWHPLISNDPRSVEILRYPLKNRIVSEEFIHSEQLEYHIINLYPNQDLLKELQ